ncbi:hypothetical protein [Sandaracinobacteroides saxicola]|uniref:Uncharacterized protein n=1 Tax=Sandaracinobacteroides saxicola TaxID=2759707 RepID=A0A7G5IIH2_9SPHN|nr:hypothetical protein [Sandaracinobacteroides saxicola]QMW23164.1 hypothetical protein H3309_01235 [Sandaracinobacteroides saxicola]
MTTPADPILPVYDNKSGLHVEARMLNKDAGFVREGRPMTVKLEAFPFMRRLPLPQVSAANLD